MQGSSNEARQHRVEVLRELNLYPLWQLRRKSADALGSGEHQPVMDKPVSATSPHEPIVSPKMPDAETGSLHWPQLKKRVTECTACELRAGCIQTVFGTGDQKADWLFVGSWPTEDDEAKGEPFAGQAGQLLDNMLAAIKLKRGVNVYLANVVKCSGSIKRSPQKSEINQCSPYLMRQIQLIQPSVIVALGHATATAMLGEDREWATLLGKVHEFRNFSKDDTLKTIPLIITHHPAALLLSPANKVQTWQDLCLARDVMQSLPDRKLK